MTLSKLILKTLTLSFLTLDVMASQLPSNSEQNQEGSRYFQRGSTHKVLQTEKRKTASRLSTRKLNMFYEELQTKEKALIFKPTKNVQEYNKKLIKMINEMVCMPNSNELILNFDKLSFKDKVANMISILQTKLEYRGSIFQTQRLQSTENEDSDPYDTTLSIGSNDGLQKPELFSFRSTFFESTGIIIPQNKTNTIAETSTLNSKKLPALNSLIVALEVAKNKIANTEDTNYDLPIYSASLMAIKLINDSKISEPKFWLRGSRSHIYAGKKNYIISNIKNILKKYIKTYNVHNPNQLDKLFE